MGREDDKMIHLISDFHFSHFKMIETRAHFGLFSTVEEMNEYMIHQFNKKVKSKDTTYFLGDFAWADTEKHLNRLNGKFIFIQGNHDRVIPAHKKIINSSSGYLDVKFGEQKFTVCHYPMHSWNCSHWGAWNFYGHHHSKTDFGGKTLNCSVDALDFNPISWDEVVEYMKTRPDNWDLIKK